MADLEGFDWPGYLRGLQDHEALALAIWLAVEGLRVGEFIEIVDHTYAAAGGKWPGPPESFVAQFGRAAAHAYAQRRRRFAGLTAVLEEALLSGAFPGDVAPQELDLRALPHLRRRQVEELLGALERARRGQG